jgi:hypothetical protein
MGAADVAGLIVRPAVTGTVRARKTKSKQHSVAKKQWVAYIGVALLSTVMTKASSAGPKRRRVAPPNSLGSPPSPVQDARTPPRVTFSTALQ